MNSYFLKDKIKLITIGFILSITIFPIYIYIIFWLSVKFPNLGDLFFYPTSIYLFIYNWYMLKDVKKQKGKYFTIALIYFILVQAFVIFILAVIFITFKIKWPKYGGGWVSSFIFIVMYFCSYLIFNQGFIIIKKFIRKREKAKKDIIELNKFQEKAKERIYEMLKDTGAKFEEFRKIEKENEVYLETGIEINGKFFAIEISEEAITLAAEKEEDAFILELIDFENANKLIDEFCKRAKEIFEKAR